MRRSEGPRGAASTVRAQELGAAGASDRRSRQGPGVSHADGARFVCQERGKVSVVQ